MGIGPVTAKRRAVFLDRDGVLNRALILNGKPYPPANLSEMEINPDAFIALPTLKALGFLLFVVTNQPDVGRGSQSKAAVEEMHRALLSELPLDDFFVCYHDDADRCECRKPRPGLLFQADKQHGIEFASSFLIGDRWRDVDAGHEAGVRSILIDYSYQERGPDHEPDIRVKSLFEAAEWIAAQES